MSFLFILQNVQQKYFPYFLSTFLFYYFKPNFFYHHLNKIKILYITKTNSFVPYHEHDIFFKIFHKSIKTYYILQKFARYWKIKHRKKEDTNFLFEDINHLPNQSKIFVFDNNKKDPYVFYIHEIIKHIVQNLTHYENELILLPKVIKNPYTNIKFNLSQLYSIYFQIIDKKQSFFLHEFFLSNFNLSKFLARNRLHIREYNIPTYISQLSNHFLSNYLYDLHCFLKVRKCTLKHDPFLPIETQIKAYKPFLSLYIHYLETWNLSLINSIESNLIFYVRLFQQTNKQFGRKKINIQKSTWEKNIYYEQDFIQVFTYETIWKEIHLNLYS